MEITSWYSRAQVVACLNISPEYVRVLTNKGRLRFIETAVGRLYDPASVAEVGAQGVGRMRKRSVPAQ